MRRPSRITPACWNIWLVIHMIQPIIELSLSDSAMAAATAPRLAWPSVHSQIAVPPVPTSSTPPATASPADISVSRRISAASASRSSAMAARPSASSRPPWANSLTASILA